MKNNASKILRETINFLNEEEVTMEPTSSPHEESIDAQIDKQFIQFEREASTSKENFKSKEYNSFESFNRYDDIISSFLFEEKDDDEENEKLNDEEEKSQIEQKLTYDDIDLLSFVNDVVRLIENFENLIEVKDTIVNRAKKFLSKEYDEQTIKVFMDVLHEEHGIVPGKSRYEQEYDIEAPKAGAAGPYGS